MSGGRHAAAHWHETDVGRGRIATSVGVLGEVMITVGVLLGLFVVYELWWTGRETAAAQDVLQDDLAEQFASPTLPSPAASAPAPDTTPELGDALALLYMPALGEEWAVVEGVGRSDLKKGPGHYPDSAMPGAVGNFAVAGHRTTYGSPFADIGELDTGDHIVAQTASGWFVYQVDDSEIVRPAQSDVIAPVPKEPGAEPTEARITLTTCHPRFSAAQRLIVYGTLVESRTPDQGPPADLA